LEYVNRLKQEKMKRTKIRKKKQKTKRNSGHGNANAMFSLVTERLTSSTSVDSVSFLKRDSEIVKEKTWQQQSLSSILTPPPHDFQDCLLWWWCPSSHLLSIYTHGR
jgi:FtsZ-interacting cell division protein YlmF